MLMYGTVQTLWKSADWASSLDEVARAGFAGVELSADVPRDVEAVKMALHAHGLRPTAAVWAPGLTDGQGLVAALNGVNKFLDFLVAVGCETLLVSEPPVAERVRVAGRVSEAGARTLTDDAWQNLADGLNELGERCKGRGIALAFQNQAGTFLETPTEIKKLMSLTDSELVGLALDTGHYVYAGGNPVQAIETWWRRIRYVHLEDLDLTVRDTAVRQGLGFGEAVKRGLFTELARGGANLHDVATHLIDIGYAGWVVAGQEATKLEPLEAAHENRRALSVLFEKAPEEA